MKEEGEGQNTQSSWSLRNDGVGRLFPTRESRETVADAAWRE